MAANTLGYNQEFPIYNADGTAFNNLVLKKSVVDSVVMSLGDKVTGDVYYRDNSLVVTMQEYIVVDGVKYTLVNPPTILREGMVSDNSQINGMTKYSFEFYHPMYMLGNIPFTDVAIDESQKKYLSQSKTFSWIGTLMEFIAKLNANLASTEWIVIPSSTLTQDKRNKLSEVMSFDKKFISDAMKDAYDTWEVPFVISQIREGDEYYEQGKRFLITYGLPSQEIYTVDEQGQPTSTPFVFRFGKGVGLKNNSRTPKNNKIITRLAGMGSERNVPYGYPQIPWTGNQTWTYTINNDPNAANSYPIYEGIVSGQRVKLIKHPFTRTTLMPSIYVETVNKKVNPYATGYNPNTEIIDYYDAANINPLAPSFETHQFEDICPQLGEKRIVSCEPYDEDGEYFTYRQWYNFIHARVTNLVNLGKSGYDLSLIVTLRDVTCHYTPDTADVVPSAHIDPYHTEIDTGSCVATIDVTIKGNFVYAKIVSSWYNETHKILQIHADPTPVWDDTMNDDGEYIQSFFKIKLPVLDFDLYACAAVTEEMSINMRSGACIGCTFTVQVDWEDYKENFYDRNGKFSPDGAQRDLDKYPKSNLGQIEVIVQKDNETFGRLLPNEWQKPMANDQFVILGISFPTSYITAAQANLDSAMREYLLENNIYYYEYPLKFDEYFLATNQGILAQIQNNNIVRFEYAGVEMALYIKQITVKYGESPLPQYDITLTDDVEIVLNKIGQVTDDVSRMRVQVSELQKYYSENLIQAINSKLSKIEDDVCMGRITFQQGLDAIGSVIFHDKIQSPNFKEGLYTGRGWRIDQLGNAEFESIRARSFLEVVELLVNRLQAQEGDTAFSDNDQIEKVQKVTAQDQSVTYILTLKEKYQGYITSQMYGNVIKGIINTLAAKEAGLSDETVTSVEVDGENKYYTSWMRVIGTHNTHGELGVNQIQVVLYGDNQVPAQKNFEPCELMTIARWGCVDYSNPDDPDYESVKDSIIRRQRMFMISTTDGRVVKYTGVDAPILKNGNYGVTIGELPEFVKNYPDVRAILDQVGEHTDWLYAQGVVVGNYIKISREGLPVPVNVFCGDWVNGSLISEPTPGNGIYFYNEYNEQTMQYEIHEVRHMGGRWQCLQHQPVRQGGVDVYHEPKWNSAYWRLVDGNDNLTIEFVSSNGFSFRRGAVNTVVTPHLFYGNVDISSDVAAENWSWTRQSESGKTDADRTWDAQHSGVKQLYLTNQDMPANWSSSNKAIFTLTVQVDDGKNIRIVDNQIIS